MFKRTALIKNYLQMHQINSQQHHTDGLRL